MDRKLKHGFVGCSGIGMHILFLTDNFPPEGNAPATRTYEHAREWVKSGHRVTVITGAPNFPEGKVFEGYSNAWYSKHDLDGIEVRRVKTYISANEGFVRRILDYMSFMIMAIFAGLFVRRVDVIVATSPQFFTAVAGCLLSGLKRKPWIFELRDIWPASITAVGAMSDESPVIKLLVRIEKWLYRKADRIVAVTHTFKRELVERGISGDKIDVVLNGVDLSKYQPMEKDPELEGIYDLHGKFVVAYVGTHGMAHALGTIVNAAERLKAHEDIVFVFAGGGAGADDVKRLVDEKKLTNVRVLGRQDKSLMNRLWSLCDVSLVHLRDTPLFSSVIPSKIFESMGMGLPMIIGVPEGEATAIVRDDHCGLVIPPEDEVAMVEAIEKIYSDPVLCASLQENAIKAANKYDRTRLAHDFLRSAEDVLRAESAQLAKSVEK
ncbi:Alpha-D-kanosaminyltransferase [BD1-7 clade bacterium]|uniref:Alpha-D-kanosaminyltransferase n=1 Tax=BD1-7 clade bacterium TaxID=2029982 RepID=A0A5S9QR90_9GAMM|nr:Alpha-D-kanosaminyltransferase [BD1-7 clade bacterium]